MKHFTLFLLVIIGFMISSCNTKTSTTEKKATAQKSPQYKVVDNALEILDDRALSTIDKEAMVEVLDSGFLWTEGPLWVDDLGALLFSDIPNNRVMKWEEGKKSSVYLLPAGYTAPDARGGEPGSNGLILDHNGQLILCQHGDRRMAKMTSTLQEPKSEFLSIADTYDGKKLNSPNDACLSSKGVLYFTDPPYGLASPELKEQKQNGVYKVNNDGDLTLLYSELTRPNGIALSPDETKLYVANSDPENAIWMEFEVTKTGDIENGKVLYNATEYTKSEKGLPDGLKVNKEGIIFATGPGGVWVFSPEGEVLAKVKTGQATSNCAFGPNEKSLYMTADDYLMRIPLK